MYKLNSKPAAPLPKKQAKFGGSFYFRRLFARKKRYYILKKFNSRADYEFCVDGLTLDKIPGKLIEFLIEENDEFKKYMKNNSDIC